MYFSFRETHSSPEVIQQWEAEFRGKLIFSHGAVAARGVLIGFRPGLDVQIHSSVQDTQGRYVLADVSIEGEKPYSG